MAYVLRNKTVKVRIRPGERCLLITSEWEPNPGKLVPSRVQMKSDKVIEVERKGKRWEVKRIELQFTSQQDATKAIEMLFGVGTPRGVESRILQVRHSLGYAWMVTELGPIPPTRSIMLSQDLKLTDARLLRVLLVAFISVLGVLGATITTQNRVPTDLSIQQSP